MWRGMPALRIFWSFSILSGDYDAVTVGGWALQELGAIPREGDAFDFEGLHVIVAATELRPRDAGGNPPRREGGGGFRQRGAAA